MSAITGIFYRDGRKVDPELIKKMNNKLSHRGADGSAVWCEGPVAMGHQMLWTTPESLHEKLPFEDEESGLVITADARIDNRDELSKELDIEDKEEVSDSYFILKSYEKWGEDCPDKLLGDFAFAIWDKNEEKLFCARDHMGVKPFYYYLDDEMFVFGTEIKALFCVPGVPRELNERKVALFLMINTQDKLSTFYDAILNIIPAHSLTISQIKCKIRKYWELNPDYQITLDSDEEYIIMFREIFKKAVKCRLRSAFPIGFELSGGLDSSSIVCMAKKILDENKNFRSILNTYSYIFDDFPQVDERNYIEKITDNNRIKPHYLLGDKISLLEEIETILWYQEQPFFTPNIAIIWNLYKKMKKDNIRILLGGNGGDEIISHGKYYLKELAVTFKWKELINEINELSKHSNKSHFNLFLIYFIFPLIPEFLKNLVPFGRRKDMFTKDGIFILNNEFAKRLGGEKYLKELKWVPITKANTAKKYHYLSIMLQQYVLEMLDHVASFHLIEPRYPYYDKRLVEFCYAIPTEMKFKFGWDRFIQRAAMADILPHEIQWRHDKTNFNPIYENNLLFEKELLEKMIYSDTFIENYVNLDLLKDIYKKYTSGNVNNNTFALWVSILIYLWLKQISLE